jgi:hypothetical protein
MNYDRIFLDDKMKWDEVVACTPHGYGHRSDYNEAMAASSGLAVSLHVFEDHGKSVIIPLAERERETGYKDIVSPYGFAGFGGDQDLLHSRKLHQAFYDMCGHEKYVGAYIMQHPRFSLPREIWDKDIEEKRNVFIIDLTRNNDELWKSLSQSHRYELKKLERAQKITLVTDKARLAAGFEKLYQETLCRINASSTYFFTEETMDILMNAPEVDLIGVEEGDVLVAASLFLSTKKDVEYYLNAATHEGRKYARYIVWFAMNYFKKEGKHCLHLGGGIRNNDTLEAFKRRFGGKGTKAQTIKAVFDEAAYNYLCGKYVAEGSLCTDYFPAYWVPRSNVQEAFAPSV